MPELSSQAVRPVLPSGPPARRLALLAVLAAGLFTAPADARVKPAPMKGSMRMVESTGTSIVQRGTVQSPDFGRGRIRVTSRTLRDGRIRSTVVIQFRRSRLKGRGTITQRGNADGYAIRGTIRVLRRTGRLRRVRGPLRVTGRGTFAPERLHVTIRP